MDKLPTEFRVHKTWKSGDRLIVARDERYHGFMLVLPKGENNDRLIKEYNFFTKVVDGEIILQPVKE